MKILKPMTNQKGMYSIEYTISFLIFILLFCFVFDLILISVQRHSVTKLTQDLVRVVQIQGGVEQTRPDLFPGTDTSYVDSTELLERIESSFRRIDIEPDSLIVRITGTNEANTPVNAVITRDSNIYLKYGTSFTVSIQYNLKWRLFSSYMTDSSERTQVFHSSGVSEYKQNYDYWEQEW